MDIGSVRLRRISTFAEGQRGPPASLALKPRCAIFRNDIIKTILKRAELMFLVRRISNVSYLRVKHVFAIRVAGYDHEEYRGQYCCDAPID
jgi:hypothetical protein